MTNGQAPMTNQRPMPNDQGAPRQWSSRGRLANRGISGARDASPPPEIPRRCAPRDDVVVPFFPTAHLEDRKRDRSNSLGGQKTGHVCSVSTLPQDVIPRGAEATRGISGGGNVGGF